MKKRIQVAVTIDETGDFGSCAIYRGIDKEHAFAVSSECLEGACLRQYLLEAEVDVPEAEVVSVSAEAVKVEEAGAAR